MEYCCHIWAAASALHLLLLMQKCIVNLDEVFLINVTTFFFPLEVCSHVFFSDFLLFLNVPSACPTWFFLSGCCETRLSAQFLRQPLIIFLFMYTIFAFFLFILLAPVSWKGGPLNHFCESLFILAITRLVDKSSNICLGDSVLTLSAIPAPCSTSQPLSFQSTTCSPGS